MQGIDLFNPQAAIAVSGMKIAAWAGLLRGKLLRFCIYVKLCLLQLDLYPGYQTRIRSETKQKILCTKKFLPVS